MNYNKTMIKIKQRISELKDANLPNSRELAEKYGHDVIIKLFYNENKFGASPKVKERIKINSPNIYPEYREPEFISFLSDEFNLSKDHFYVSNGSDAILDAIPQIFASRKAGNNVVIPELTFGSIEATCKVSDLEVRKVNLVEGKIDLNKMKEAIDENTAIVYIVNPNMPTGTLNSHKEIDEFISSIPSTTLVVIDEAYIEYSLGIEKAYANDTKLIEKYDNLIITHTLSKAYGIAAFRVGYMISRPYIVSALMKSYQYLPVNKYSIQAAEAAMRDKEFYNDVINKTNAEKERYYVILDELNLKYYKSFGNFIYIFVDNNSKIEEHLLKKYGVAIRSVRDNALRITIGKPEENDLVFKGLRDIYA